jgi:hypothetical protein
MSTSLHEPSVPSTAPARPVVALPRPLLLLAAALGLASAAFGGWLFLHPGSVLARDPAVFLLRAVLGPRATAATLAGLGLAGALGASLVLVVVVRNRRPALLVLALVQVAAWGVALQSVTTISLAGYLLAAALPLGVVVLLALVVRRYRRLRWLVLAGVLAAVVVVALSWSAVAATLTRLGGALAAGFVVAAPRIGVTVLAGAVVAAWALVALRLLRGSPRGRSAGLWVLRHRCALTLVAAAGPLPYGLLRLSWLTPWPLVSPEEDLPAELRLWGLLLGGAALLGSVLTLGLVLPWGERFPRWFPGLAGRSVPVAAAVVPGGLVAGLVCAAAVPMLRLALLPAADEVSDGLGLWERVGFALVFPFWVWGPALALAVWGYAQHRSVAAPGTDARG